MTNCPFLQSVWPSTFIRILLDKFHIGFLYSMFDVNVIVCVFNLFTKWRIIAVNFLQRGNVEFYSKTYSFRYHIYIHPLRQKLDVIVVKLIVLGTRAYVVSKNRRATCRVVHRIYGPALLYSHLLFKQRLCSLPSHFCLLYISFYASPYGCIN